MVQIGLGDQMEQPLRVLMVGGSKDKNRLVINSLQQGGYDPKYREVNTAEQMQAALDDEEWDLIVSDCITEFFCNLDALTIARKTIKDAPFIIVSKKKEPEHFLASISAGVNDFITFDELGLLSPIVQREIKTAHIRRSYRRTEEAIQKCEASFRLLLNTTPSAVLVTDGQTKQILDANRAAEKLYGYSRLELFEMCWEDLCVQPTDTPDGFKSNKNDHNLQKPCKSFPQLHRKRTGEQFQAEIFQGFMTNLEKIPVMSIINDISDTKLLEKQLFTLQKRELLGRLAGYIAHDFNNLLGIIIGYSHLALWELENPSPMRNNIEEISNAAHRAADLTRQLLSFSRKEILQPKVVDVNELARNVEPMLRRLIGEHIELEIDLFPEPILAKVDPGLMEQVIMNISISARDDMPKGGKIRIETRSANIGPDDIDEVEKITPGLYVMLSVSHIALHNEKKPSEVSSESESPGDREDKFYDIGLSVAQDIIRKCDGYFTVNTDCEKGSCTRIYLPKAQRVISEHHKNNLLKRGVETILVVEDDELLLELIDRMLTLCGYNILCATHGNEALQLAERHIGAIHLMLTDVILPHMCGANLASSMEALQPKMKVLFMSGYSNEAIDHHGISDQYKPIIQKPFTLEKLSVIVRSVLDDDNP